MYEYNVAFAYGLEQDNFTFVANACSTHTTFIC